MVGLEDDYLLLCLVNNLQQLREGEKRQKIQIDMMKTLKTQ